MKESEKIKKRYDRVSVVYDWMDKMIKQKWRQEILQHLKGNVLEVGIGTGGNLTFYPKGISLTGIDFSPGMLNKARKKAGSLNLPYQLKLLEMNAENMNFPDDSFDYVVATCVYCSVPNPINGLKEMRRVCKPKGEILLLEHMRSENEAIGKIMDVLNPLTVKLWGANINRKTINNIHKAGLVIEREEKLMGTIVKDYLLNQISKIRNNE